MMQLKDLITPECTASRAQGNSKKRVLKLISGLIHQAYPDIPANAVLDSLIQRERLGSTAIGSGVALPHCRVPFAEKPICAMIQLSEGIDFEANDREPVDLVFALIVPDNEEATHLEILQALAQRLSQSDYCQALRNANDGDSLYSAIISLDA